MLDPEHLRQDQDEDVKGAIQRDAAECLMQLALFGPARDMLQQDATLLDTLRMLVDKAWTEEAKQYAEGALMALDPHEHEHEIDVDALHVMMSYQWAVQVRVSHLAGVRLMGLADHWCGLSTVYRPAHRGRLANSRLHRVDRLGEDEGESSCVHEQLGAHC